MRLSSIMFVIVALSLCFIFLGCDIPKPPKPTYIDGQRQLVRYETPEVVCFRVDEISGVWCHWRGE